MNLVRFMEICLNETYSKVRIGKYVSDPFVVQNGLKQGMFYSQWSSPVLQNMPLGKYKKIKWD
jgi:hypothetical protein